MSEAPSSSAIVAAIVIRYRRRYRSPKLRGTRPGPENLTHFERIFFFKDSSNTPFPPLDELPPKKQIPGNKMPIILPPTTRRQFIKGSLALGSTAMMTSRALAGADDQRVKLDQNRVALLADTHISADPNLVYPGTKWLHGHTHEWQHDQQDHLHLINQPAVSYHFGKGHAHGWVDMKLTLR